MKRTMILLLWLGFVMTWGGEARGTQYLAHSENDAKQRAQLYQTLKNEETKLKNNRTWYEAAAFIENACVGDLGYILPNRAVTVYQVVDDWNCILCVHYAAHELGGDQYRRSDAEMKVWKTFVWLEGYYTKDIFAGDRVYVVGKVKIVDEKSVEKLAEHGGEESQREMKIRVIRLPSQDELKNPGVYEARRTFGKLKKAEAAGDEKEIDKAYTRLWTISGKRTWAVFDSIKGGNVVLRIPTFDPAEEAVDTEKIVALKLLSKDDQAWIEEMKKLIP